MDVLEHLSVDYCAVSVAKDDDDNGNGCSSDPTPAAAKTSTATVNMREVLIFSFDFDPPPVCRLHCGMLLDAWNAMVANAQIFLHVAVVVVVVVFASSAVYSHSIVSSMPLIKGVNWSMYWSMASALCGVWFMERNTGIRNDLDNGYDADTTTRTNMNRPGLIKESINRTTTSKLLSRNVRNTYLSYPLNTHFDYSRWHGTTTTTTVITSRHNYELLNNTNKVASYPDTTLKYPLSVNAVTVSFPCHISTQHQDHRVWRRIQECRGCSLIHPYNWRRVLVRRWNLWSWTSVRMLTLTASWW